MRINCNLPPCLALNPALCKTNTAQQPSHTSLLNSLYYTVHCWFTIVNININNIKRASIHWQSATTSWYNSVAPNSCRSRLLYFFMGLPMSEINPPGSGEESLASRNAPFPLQVPSLLFAITVGEQRGANSTYAPWKLGPDFPLTFQPLNSPLPAPDTMHSLNNTTEDIGYAKKLGLETW